MPPIEFAVWTLLAVFTLFFLFNWLLKRRKLKDTLLFETRERIALQAAPWVVIAWTVFLIVFLFVNLSKFTLLVVFPLLYLFVNQQVAKKMAKEE